MSAPLTLATVAPDVLAHLANAFLTDAEAASLACADTTTLEVLCTGYDLKRACTLSVCRHVSTPRTLPRLGRITVGTARRVVVGAWDHVADWRALLADDGCRVTQFDGSLLPVLRGSGAASAEGWRWPRTLQSIILDDWTEAEMLCESLPRHQLSSLSLRGRLADPTTALASLVQLRRLALDAPLECANAELHLPPELEELSFAGCAEGDFAALQLPGSIAKLALIGDFNASLGGVVWPSRLVELTIGAPHYDDGGEELILAISSLRLPASLGILHFGWAFDQALDRFAWPPALHTLILGEEFKQLDSIVLPSLTHLCLGGGESTSQLQSLRLPSSLRHLELPTNWEGRAGGFPALPPALTFLRAKSLCTASLVDVEWPCTLATLELPSYRQPLVGLRLPAGLARLEWGGEEAPLGQPSGFDFPPFLTDLELHLYDPVHGPRLPAGLKRLLLRRFDLPVEALELPSLLEELHFGEFFDQPVRTLRLLASLLRLHFGARFNQAVHSLCLPRGLSHLSLGGRFDNRVDEVDWPPQLTYLHCGNSFDQPLGGVRLPDTVAYLHLGAKFGTTFRQSLVSFRRPACLARLVYREFALPPLQLREGEKLLVGMDR